MSWLVRLALELACPPMHLPWLELACPPIHFLCLELAGLFVNAFIVLLGTDSSLVQSGSSRVAVVR